MESMMKKITLAILTFVILLITIIQGSSYTAPGQSVVDLVFGTGYTAPGQENVPLLFGEEGGIVIPSMTTPVANDTEVFAGDSVNWTSSYNHTSGLNGNITITHEVDGSIVFWDNKSNVPANSVIGSVIHSNNYTISLILCKANLPK